MTDLTLSPTLLYFATHPHKDPEYPRPRPKITCADGFNFSVQASQFHYCTPRVTHSLPYTEVEVGYPSADEPTLHPYIDGDLATADLLSSVYGYVPIDIVDAIIVAHGGITNPTATTS